MPAFPTRRPLGTLAVVTSGALLLASSGLFLDAARARRPSELDALLETPPLPSDVVRVLSLGFESAVADASYLQAIQVYGERKYDQDEADRIRKGKAIARLLDYVTDLDPDFAYGYVFGAYAIPVTSFQHRTFNVDEAISLLRKGVAHDARDWRLPFHLAFQHTTVGEFAEAAPWMAEAARRPGRPDYVPMLATRLAAQGDALETGLSFARAMLAEADDPKQRDELETRVRLLEMEQHLRRIESAVTRFHAREKRWPSSVATLLESRDLDVLPEEPHGGTYVIDPATGEVRSSAAERLRVSKRYLDELRQARGETVDPESAPKEAATTP